MICTALIVSACGGSTGDSEPDLQAALEQTGSEVTPNPDTSVDPQTQPEMPSTGTDNSPIVPDSPVALIGSVSTYPDTTNSGTAANDDATSLLSDDISDVTSLTREDMQPVQALVSLFLLADVSFEFPVATVKTDSTGNYNVTASDVQEYLLQQNLIEEDATDEQILAEFRSLGRLQVRALFVRERNGESRAIAIQSLADPADVDESGNPVPVAVDPIVHRVVKVIVDSIRDSIESLESMGLSSTLVEQLIESVVEEVVVQIDQILEDTADEVIEIPDGLTLDDVVENQEQELELNVEPQQLDQLTFVLDGADGEADSLQIQSVESIVSTVTPDLAPEDSTLESSLNTESQGLLASFASAFTDQLDGSVEQTISEARAAGTEEALSEVFGEGVDAVEIEQALASIDLERENQSRLSIQRFFLSLGLAVLVDENDAGDAGVLAVQLSLPYHLESAILPGTAGLGERDIRLFKVGSGELDTDSHYTSNPFVQLGLPDEDGEPTPPFLYVPPLAEVTDQVLQDLVAEDAQQVLDQAVQRVFANAQPTGEDYRLLDRVDVLYQLRERLHDTTLVSSQLIDVLVANRDQTIALKRIAATIANKFEWVQEDIRLTPEGFPIYSDRSGPLAGGANVVDSSQLVRALSITLGESPSSTVSNLTQSTGFLAKYAPSAIDFALQRFDFNEQTDLTDALLEIYPQDIDGYRELITGAISGEPTPEYSAERDLLARGLITAIPSDMYGQTLSSESEVNIRSALFFLDYLLGREYLIDDTRGFYTEFDIVRSDGVPEVRLVPAYANVKRLDAIGEISVAEVIADLLSMSTIEESSFFSSAREELMGSLSDIPILSEYEEPDIETFTDGIDARVDFVDAYCAVQMFDGSDAEEQANRLNLSVFEVDYIESTGERLKGSELDVVISSELTENEHGLVRIYRLEDLPTRVDDQYGRDYVLRFDIDSYQNSLPELYLYADGYVPEINLCDLEAPLYIGPDQGYVQLPGIGLVSNQLSFEFSTDNADTNGDSLFDNEQFQWVDISNFEIPGAALFVTQTQETEGQGSADFRLAKEGAAYNLIGPADGEVGFSRLYGSYIDGKLQLALQPQADMAALTGLERVVGASARDVIESVNSGEIIMSSTLFVGTGNPEVADIQDADEADLSDTSTRADSPAVFADDVLDSGFEPEALFLFRDREGNFWVLELRYFETFMEFDNTEQAVIDIGVASINSIGLIDVPNVVYDNAFPGDADEFSGINFEYYSLYYGDWLVLENPSDYNGAELLPPEALAFTNSGDYDQLRQALDGIVIRYSGEHFDENVTDIEDVERQFDTPSDFSSVPVRLDAGREGITFAKLAFDRTEKRYVMDPLPQDAAPFVTQLDHNDLVAIFDDQSANDGPEFLVRVVRDSEDAAMNLSIGLEVLRYGAIFDEFEEFDEREVVCFLEDGRSCPEHHPQLFSAIDAFNAIGIVYDNDVDGVPSLFDPNDHDPYVPDLLTFDEGFTDFDDYDSNDALTIESVTGVSDDGTTVRALIARTVNTYPGDIESITLKSALFGDDSTEQLLLSCEPPLVEDFGLFSGVRCATQSVADDIEVELYQQSERSVSFIMLMDDDKLNTFDNYLDFEYQIHYRDPIDFDGQPLTCGDELCPARPNSSGSVTVPLVMELPTHRQVTIQEQGEEAVDLLGLRSLNVDRELRISAASLPGALEHELIVYCPGSSQTDLFNSEHYYQPEEELRFYAAARDDSGSSIPVDFLVHIPWLAGRECRISLRSPIETDSGELAGYSLYVQAGVEMTGAADSGVFVDNETVFNVGDNVCIEEDIRLTTDNCTASDALFTVQTVSDQSDVQQQIILDMGEQVISAFTDSYSIELLHSRLSPGAQISFDGLAEAAAPGCAQLTGSVENISTCSANEQSLQDVFLVSTDGLELRLQLQDAFVEGPVNDQGNIPLTTSGYYTVLRQSNSTPGSEPDNMDLSHLMNIMIESFETDTGELEAYARFESAAFGDDFSNFDDDTQLLVNAPAHTFMRTSDGHEVSLDVRSTLNGQMGVIFYVHKPMLVAGLHDLNGDGLSDIEVFQRDGEWVFLFDTSVDAARDFIGSEEQEFPIDDSGYRTAAYPAEHGFVELLVRIGDFEYLVIANLSEGGFGELFVETQYPVAEEQVDPLFDGQDFEHFFPVELSAASPFTREIVDPRDETFFYPDEFDFFDPDGTDSAGLFFADDPALDSSDDPSDAAALPDNLSFISAANSSGFEADAQRIAGILSGRFTTAEFFNTDNLRSTAEDAHCFGPAMLYQNHPDGADAEPMIGFANEEVSLFPGLPQGDLGIWMEYEPASGQACAAAQMNAQLNAARQRTFTGLVTLASMVRRLTPEQQADVLSGAEVSVAERMNALTLPNVYFEQAFISRQPDTGDWFYRVTMLEGSADDEESFRISVDMNFNPGSDSELWDYSGAIRLRIEDELESSGCPETSVEHLSSLVFERQNQQQLNTEYRYGLFCGHDGVNGFDDQQGVDPLYSSAVADNGWVADFSILTANMNPVNGAGHYSYSWQAGVNDSHSRVLNVGLNDFDPMDGVAWYGYGQSFDNGAQDAGQINGFICNWAGPGNNHTLLNMAQRQSLIYSAATDQFVVSDGGSNITYAPTVACVYSSDEGGSFLYDRDLDGELGDESADTVDVGTGEQLPLDLAPPENSVYFGMDIEDVILRSGFMPPESPGQAR